MNATGGYVLGDILTWSARRFSQKAVVVTIDGQRHSYRALDADANRLANGLIGLGVQPQEVVALVSPNSYEFVAAVFGIARTGAALLPLNPIYTAPEFDYILNDARPSTLIVDASALPTFDRWRERFPSLRRLVVVGADAELTWSSLLERASERSPAVDIDEHWAQSILYTSGTTGRPKGAVLSHRARVINTASCVIGYAAEPADVSFIPIPMFHSGGLLLGIFDNLAAGATMVVPRQFDVDEMIHAVRELGVNYLYGVPTIIYRLLESPQFATVRGSVRKLLYGGSSIPEEVARRAQADLPHVAFYQGYGTTECAQLSTLPPEAHRVNPFRTGYPLPFVELVVMDDNLQPVKPGEVGELMTRGPHVLTEYLNRPEDTAEACRGGWFHLGDQATVEEDGCFTVIGRKSEMIISGGFNIYPREVEDVLHAHPAIAEAAVFGVPDLEWGQTVAAAIVPRADAQVTEAEVVDYCRTRLASYKKPRTVRFLANLPRTPAGKVQKHVLLDQWTA